MDDFKDLLWTTPPAPSNGASHTSPSKIGSNLRPQNDTFSLLASAALKPSYATSSRAQTPSLAIPLSTSATRTISPSPSSKQSGTFDPFGSLLSIGSSANGQNMSIAERQALVERERQERARKEREELKAQGMLWDQLDKGMNGKSALQPAVLPQRAPSTHTSLHPTPPSSRPVSSGSRTNVEEDPWDFGLLSSAPTRQTSPPDALSSDPFDFSAFDEPLAAPVPHHPVRIDNQKREVTPRTISPGDFDFGDREMSGGLLDEEEDDDDDDVLGALAKPVKTYASRDSPNLSDQQSYSSAPANRSSVPSPPPHVIGQIVEMGFSPQQARQALAVTSTGIDVQAALEILLQQNAPAEDVQHPSREDEERRQAEADEERRRKRRAGPSRTSARAPQSTSGEASTSSAEVTSQLQEQADRLLAQASEIGLSVFNRANAFWKEGKAQAQKLYEERKGTSPILSGAVEKVGGGVKQNGRRPKWMLQEGDEEDSDTGKESGVSGFRDDDGEDPALFSGKAPTPASPPTQRAPPRPQKVASLFSDDDVGYVSPARRGKQRAAPSSQPSTSRSPQPPREPSPPLRQRSWTPASASVEAMSTQQRSQGTEQFKLGQFADSETSYTSAIDILPEGHFFLIPLHNNRAAARLKTGDHKGTIEDCTRVIEVIGLDYHPRKEVPVPSGVDFGDALVKALSRRAGAWEAAEKWDKARDDWEKLIGLDCGGTAVGKMRGEAVRGAGRCRKMLDVVSSTTSSNDPVGQSNVGQQSRPKPKVAPKPAPRPQGSSSSSNLAPSEALSRLREANNQQESEEQARMAYKDSVDAKIAAWKGGKENNLRALIASLDTVLWKELGWAPVGMHELVTPNQVKVKYVRAIAKVHPDKLNTQNATLEHRMIANGVFGALNEAWNTFKP